MPCCSSSSQLEKLICWPPSYLLPWEAAVDPSCAPHGAHLFPAGEEQEGDRVTKGFKIPSSGFVLISLIASLKLICC